MSIVLGEAELLPQIGCIRMVEGSHGIARYSFFIR